MDCLLDPPPCNRLSIPESWNKLEAMYFLVQFCNIGTRLSSQKTVLQKFRYLLDLFLPRLMTAYANYEETKLACWEEAVEYVENVRSIKINASICMIKASILERVILTIRISSKLILKSLFIKRNFT